MITLIEAGCEIPEERFPYYREEIFDSITNRQNEILNIKMVLQNEFRFAFREVHVTEIIFDYLYPTKVITNLQKLLN